MSLERVLHQGDVLARKPTGPSVVVSGECAAVDKLRVKNELRRSFSVRQLHALRLLASVPLPQRIVACERNSRREAAATATASLNIGIGSGSWPLPQANNVPSGWIAREWDEPVAMAWAPDMIRLQWTALSSRPCLPTGPKILPPVPTTSPFPRSRMACPVWTVMCAASEALARIGPSSSTGHRHIARDVRVL